MKLVPNINVEFHQLTLLHDLELKELTKGVIVPEGGVKENNIHKVTNCASKEESLEILAKIFAEI